MLGRRNDDWCRVIEERVISQRNTHFNGREVADILIEQNDVVVAATRELQHLLPRSDPRRGVAFVLEQRLERATHPIVTASDESRAFALGFHYCAGVGRARPTLRGALARPTFERALFEDRAVCRGVSARSTYHCNASLKPCATVCVGENDSIRRAVSMLAHEKRMSPGRKGSCCGSTVARRGCLIASPSRII